MSRRNKKVKEKGWAGVVGAARWLGEQLKGGAVAVGFRGVLFGIMVASALWGLHLARRGVAEMPRFRVRPAHFRAQAPPWCAGDLEAVMFPRESYSIFDRRLTRDVAAAYLESPWVKAVRRVEKRFPNQLAVELELREPAAFVRLPDVCCAIDAEGVRLPLDYDRWDHARRPLPLIFGVRGDPPAPGRPWADRGTQAAVAVLNALAAEAALLRQIHFVDVGNLDGRIDPLRSEVLLYTRGRVRVAWGRPPNIAMYGEPSVARKLARLRQWLARPMALANGASNIDLRFPDELEKPG